MDDITHSQLNTDPAGSTLSNEGLLPSSSHRVINVCVIPMEKGEESYTMPIVIKGIYIYIRNIYR